MDTTESTDRSLIQKLKSEARICAVCKFEIRNPFIERCPRCNDKLPQLQLECGGCVHRLSCPVVEHASDAISAKNVKNYSNS